MTWLRTIFVALSTYSAIPVPQFPWDDKYMRYAICFLPLVGVVCGGLVYGWFCLAQWLEVSALLFAVVAACIPVLVTGGIHLDGYMDTQDALASHQSREWKLTIMKDSHCGAFAVIHCCVYFLLSAGLLGELYRAGAILSLAPVYVLSRSLSALCAVTMPNARNAGMLHAYTKDTAKRRSAVAMIVLSIACGAGLVLIDLPCGLVTIVFSLACVLRYRRMVMKEFGGVTGDTAGYFLQSCELWCMAGIWLGGLL